MRIAEERKDRTELLHMFWFENLLISDFSKLCHNHNLQKMMNFIPKILFVIGRNVITVLL